MAIHTQIIKFISFTLFTFLIPTAHATVQEVSPYIVLEKVGEQLFSRIASSQQQLSKRPQYMNIIVEEELMPTIDYKYAAYKMLGKYLPKTSKIQRKAFVDAIRHFLIRTYAISLAQYKNQQVVFEPVKSTAGKRIVAINTKIIDLHRPDINIVFKMRQSKKTKQWKAFDMVIEGISLLSSKQSELSSRIAKQGIDKVTLKLSSLNN